MASSRFPVHLVAALLALVAFVAAPVRADTWAPPSVRTYVSDNGQYRLTVVPREIESQLAYFEAKVRGETLPEPEGPLGRFERLDGGAWVSVWSRGLVNEVAPVDALVSDDGHHVVTFDNWHSLGHGDHVVAIYGDSGALIRSLRLDDIVPPYFIDALPASVSSIYWKKGAPRFAHGKFELAVAEPGQKIEEGGSFLVRIALADGIVEPIAKDRMAALVPKACQLHIDQVHSFNDYLAFERSDLALPTMDDENGWRRYLHHAVARLTPERDDRTADEIAESYDGMLDESAFELLDSGAYMEKDFRDGFREALAAPASQLRRRWFAARDQERFVAEIERTAKKIKPGQLSGTDMRFFADNAHWPRIATALAGSGASLMQIDVEVPIPPRPEKVTKLPPHRTVDPACAAFVG